ncbi:PEGA domain-containing protein [Salinisphaera hydrothermalis]|uniref:PEGA domain-containing protein n=1 Tax=Salinisphaera hydrothermalis TaxID=563188 RepID=UPI003340EA94
MPKKRPTSQSLIALTSIVALSGCATMIHGTHQDISVKSNPADSTIVLDGKTVGTTPMKVSMSRKHPHTLMIKHPGYYIYKTEIKKSSSGAEDLGGLVGMGVDHMTGGAYNLVPSKVDATLLRKPLTGATVQNLGSQNKSGS